MGVITRVFTLSGTETLWTLAIVALGMTGNMSYTFAVKWVSPTKANVFRSFEVILNLVLQLVLEHMAFHPDNHLPGIALLLLAVLAIDQETNIRQRNLHRWI